jgi:hypothetical protein
MQKQFHAQKGFGGNPLDNGNYWMMLPSMFERGLQTGAITELNFMDNVIADYDKVWKGYKREQIGDGFVDVHQDVKKWLVLDETKKGNEKYADEILKAKKNYNDALKLAEDGYRVKVLPQHFGKDGWKNPDYLIDGELWELKSPTSIKMQTILGRIREGEKQANNMVLEVAKEVDYESLLHSLRGQILLKENPLETKNFIINQNGNIKKYTKEQIVYEGKMARGRQIEKWKTLGKKKK